MKDTGRGRLEDLDLARALALAAMLWAHWHPAIILRLPWLDEHSWPLQVLSRLASPAFVTVFGLTMGAWLWRSPAPLDAAAVRRRLTRRVGLLFLSALIVASPGWIQLAWSGRSSPMDYLFRLYSILLFYVPAVALMIPAGRVLRASAPARFVVIGGVCWLLHELLAFNLLTVILDWPIAEWLRMVFVSGQYAFFALMGWSFFMMPIGGWLWRRARQGRDRESLWHLGALGLALAIVGVIDGVGWSELGLSQLREALVAQAHPPRIWFYALFGGSTLVLTSGLGFLRRATPKARFVWEVVGAIGRNSLPIFVASGLIHPTLDLIEWRSGASSRWSEVLVFSAFFFLCAWLVQADRQRRVGSLETPPPCRDRSELHPSDRVPIDPLVRNS